MPNFDPIQSLSQILFCKFHYLLILLLTSLNRCNAPNSCNSPNSLEHPQQGSHVNSLLVTIACIDQLFPGAAGRHRDSETCRKLT